MISSCFVSGRRTREASKSKSSGLEAKNDDGRSASEGMFPGMRDGSVGEILAYREMRSSVCQMVSLELARE